jgi:hypothetical protein
MKRHYLKYWDFLFLMLLTCTGNHPSEFQLIDTEPIIFPDYTNVVFPVNIAPPNFIIQQEGAKYVVEFCSKRRKGFSILSKSHIIQIPVRKWKKFVSNNVNDSIYFIIYVKKSGGGWDKYKPVKNRVSEDPIDPYIVYRRINAALIFWENMAIVQRCTEDYTESDILSNQNTKKNCMHCHTFGNRNPENFLLHLRGSPNGTILITSKKTLFLNTKTSHTLSAFVYPSWHPGGRYIAFSTNKIHQNLFGSGDRINHVRDDASDLVIYDIDSNLVFTNPQVATLDFENLPSWSPDGKFLYYIKSDYKNKFLPDTSEHYDLMRIPFDDKTRNWGTAEIIVSSAETGLSSTFPQVAPDGKFVVFCMADYGYFNIINNSSDLYLYNIEDSSYINLPLNSEYAESYPYWSDNGRWIMFTTKRIDGIYTIPHFSYFDTSGTVHKPFPLPLEDPEAYYTRLTNFNRPVFIKGRVEFTQDELLKLAYSKPGAVIFDSLHVDMDAISGATTTNQTSQQTGVPYMKD